jgi:DNA (cytosine-5)-methyltransferase 1
MDKQSSSKKFSRSPSAISLFSGAGGFDTGLEMAGFTLVSALDNDRDCIETLRLNKDAAIAIPGQPGRTFLKDTQIFEDDVWTLDPSLLKPQSVTADWTPDLLVGGPPCQPFSSSGRQLSLLDPRGRLFEAFVHMTLQLRPRFVLFENVRGLVTAIGRKGEPGEALQVVNNAFEELGYGTRWALLNAADYGAPQRRVRLFMVASRSTPLPAFPAPTHARNPGQDGLFHHREPWNTLGEFLRNRPKPAPDEIVRPSSRLQSQLAGIPDGCGLRSPGARETTRPGGHWGYKQGTFIASLNQPARTVTTSTQDWIREADGSLRRLTSREAAALQGFPPQWQFAGSSSSRLRQIGNAVPSLLGLVIGRELVQALASSEGGRPTSAPLPTALWASIVYTRREVTRNAESRQRAKEQTSTPVALRKGLGSLDPRPPSAKTRTRS